MAYVVHEDRAFVADAVDVGGFPDHQAAMVDARLHPADVVAHDEEDVGLLLLLRGRRQCSPPPRRRTAPASRAISFAIDSSCDSSKSLVGWFTRTAHSHRPACAATRSGYGLNPAVVMQALYSAVRFLLVCASHGLSPCTIQVLAARAKPTACARKHCANSFTDPGRLKLHKGEGRAVPECGSAATRLHGPCCGRIDAHGPPPPPPPS